MYTRTDDRSISTGHRRTITRKLATITLLASLAASACSASSDTDSAASAVGDEAVAGADDRVDPSEFLDAPADDGSPSDSDEDANDLLDDSLLPEPEAPTPQEEPPPDQADQPVEVGPTTNEQPQAHPCDDLPADGSSLVVGPDPLVLDQGDLDGSLFIVNCSDGDIDWTAATKPSVSLDDDGANLLPGEFAELDFAIDSGAWEPGAVDFKIKVSEPGHNHYVDVHAFRQLTGKDIVAGNGTLTAGEGAGGCNNQCIVSAQLRPNFTTPNLGLDVATNTPATIRTWVSTQPSVEHDGVPSFPGVGAIDTSPAGVSQHHASLAPLGAGTHYNIIVSATDEHDNTSYRVGEFTTITPVENPSNFQKPGEAPGCSVDCITAAVLTAGGDHTSKHLSVASHTAAQFQVSLATEAPTWAGDVPTLEDPTLWQPSGLEFVTTWETDLGDLDASTDYHIVVQATDANGNVDYRAGEFRTADAPAFTVVYTNLGIRVHSDGDKGANRGELRFTWRVDNEHAGARDEEKISSGDFVGFSGPNSIYAAHDVTSYLPLVGVAAFERDADGIQEFCTMGYGTPLDAGGNDDCDVVWSVANGGGIYTLDTVDQLPTCADVAPDIDFGAHAGERCIVAAMEDSYGGRPEFTSYISVRVLD